MSANQRRRVRVPRFLQAWLLGLRRELLEVAVRVAAVRAPRSVDSPDDPTAIFLLRNNDLGDLIIVTPLFDALRRRFPAARIVVGIGAWNRDVLAGNPHIDEVLVLTAPWHNKYLGLPPDGRPRTLAINDLRAARYIAHSPEVAALRRYRFDIGIDILGSAWGSLLLMRAGIAHRLGMEGYEGGHTGAQQTVQFNPDEHVGRTALRFAERLGATDLPPLRPQIFLTNDERGEAEQAWATAGAGGRAFRVVLAPGGGLPAKCWPQGHFAELARELVAREACVVVVGGPGDLERAQAITEAGPAATSLVGRLSLRQTFAMLATADLVVCNGSMVMHASAAFEIPTVVVLSDAFESAATHDRQWGYPTCLSIGRERDRKRISTPTEVLEAARRLVPQSALLGEMRDRSSSGSQAAISRGAAKPPER